MTVEEIKQSYTMLDIVERYGFHPNRAGFISCPFHSGDRTPSLKVYNNNFHCHACGANGDIFTFVQKMESCNFKTAFYSLGGEYQDHHKARMARYHAQKALEKRKKEEARLKQALQWNNAYIHVYRELMKREEPASDDWYYWANKFYMALITDAKLQEGGGGRGVTVK
jgi:DNA primase